MSEAIAFFGGLITMTIVWFVHDTKCNPYMRGTETYKVTTDIKIDSFAKNTESTGISFGFSFYASKPANIEKIVEDATNKYKEVFTKALQNAIGD